MMTISIGKVDATCPEKVTLTSGMVKAVQIAFAFSEEWNEFNKIAVFSNGTTTLDVPLDAVGRCYIPHEVLAVAGRDVSVGIYGSKGEGADYVAIPTVKCSLGKVVEGVDPTGEESAEPTPTIWDELTIQVENLDGVIRELDDSINAIESRINVVPAGSGTLTLYGTFNHAIYFDIRSDSYFEVSYSGRKDVYGYAVEPDKVRVTMNGVNYPCNEIVIKGQITSFWADTYSIINVKAKNLDSLKAFRYNNWHGDEFFSLDEMPNLELLRLVDSPINKITATEKYPELNTFIKLNHEGKDIEFKPTEISKTDAYFLGYKYGGKMYKPNDLLCLDGTDTNIEPVFQEYQYVIYVDEVNGAIEGDGSLPTKAVNSFDRAVRLITANIPSDKDVVIRLLSDASFAVAGSATTMLSARTGTVTIETADGEYSRRRLTISGSNWYAGVECKTVFRNIVLLGSGTDSSNSMTWNAGYFTSLGIKADVRFENVDCFTLPIVSFNNSTIEGIDTRFGMIRYGSTGWNHGASVTIAGDVFVNLKNCSVNRLNSSACGYKDGDASGNYGAGTISGSLTIVCDNSNIKYLTSPSASKPTRITNGLYLYSINGSIFPNNDFVITNGTHSRTIEVYGGRAEVYPHNNYVSFYTDHPRRIATVEGDYGTPNQVGQWDWQIQDGITVADFNKTYVASEGGYTTITFNPSSSEGIKGEIQPIYDFCYGPVTLPEIVNIPLPQSLTDLYITTDDSEFDCSGLYNLERISFANSQNLMGINVADWDRVSILDLSGVPARKTIIESLPTHNTARKYVYVKGITQSEIDSINVPIGWVIEDNTLYVL